MRAATTAAISLLRKSGSTSVPQTATLALYMDGATGDNVLEKIAENRTKHRGAGAVLGEDAPRSS